MMLIVLQQTRGWGGGGRWVSDVADCVTEIMYVSVFEERKGGGGRMENLVSDGAANRLTTDKCVCVYGRGGGWQRNECGIMLIVLL